MTHPHEEKIAHLTFWMLPVPGGTFRMGSKKEDEEAFDWEKPDHDVMVRDFHLGQYPVTQDLWRAVAEASVGVTLSHADTTLDPNPSFFEGDRRPVEQVSWDDAQVFIQKLNALTAKSRPDGLVYRLPTEAEWEYASLTPGPSPNGEESHDTRRDVLSRLPSPVWRGARGEAYAGSDKLHEVGWFADNSHGETKPVGLKMPNALGLYDMSGNVWEWCEDWYSDKYYGECLKKGVVTDPRGPKTGSGRVFRGGSWCNTARVCRSAYRNRWPPDFRGDLLSFRLALAPQ